MITLIKKNISIILLFVLLLNVVSFKMTYCYWYENEYSEIDEAFWDNKTARWSVSGYASEFELILYKDGRVVANKKTGSTYVGLSQYITRSSGEYYFEVRPYNRYHGWGNWVSSSTEYFNSYEYDNYNNYHYHNYYRDNNIYTPSKLYDGEISFSKNQGPPTTSVNQYDLNLDNKTLNQSIPGLSITNKQVLNVPSPQILNQNQNGLNLYGQFIEAYGIWHFIYPNGAYATNAWVQYNSKWYYIDLSGNMAVGLYTINGVTYLLNADGSMATGYVTFDGATHYFNEAGIMMY